MGGQVLAVLPAPAAGPTCPLTSLARIWGSRGVCPSPDRCRGRRWRQEVEAEVVFSCVLSLSGGRAAAGYFWELVFIPGDGGREMLPSNL